VLLGAGQPVDLARSRAQLGTDAAEKHRAADPVLGHRTGRVGAEPGVPGDRIGSWVKRGWAGPEQRVGAPGLPDDRRGVAQIGFDHIGVLSDRWVEPGGVVGEQRGPDPGLDEQLHDPRSDVAGGGANDDLHELCVSPGSVS
jgi:hypothetical protein